MISEKLMKPAQYAEHQVLTSILQGKYPPGTNLPGERKLAEEIGVTRPTLRETLQKMGREGWLIIRHGKPTMVNDYLHDGGMGVLSTMARYGEDLPKEFLEQFLEMRVVLLPPVVRMTMDYNPQALEDYLMTYSMLENSGESYADYDWELQMLMAKQSGNLFFRFFLKDFEIAFRRMAVSYFDIEDARNISRNYYQDLLGHVRQRDNDQVVNCVFQVMTMALDFWKLVMG